MDHNRIQAFFITPSARSALGETCFEGAFDWARVDPDLRRLTFGPLDMDRLANWNEACFDAFVEPLLVLGPDDRTPDFVQHPMLLGIKLMSAHGLETPDMDALRGILHEPDEIFTTFWEDYAGGYRAWFLPPGPAGSDGEPFWKTYREALGKYKGSVLGMSQEEFDARLREAWLSPLKRRDLSEVGYADGDVVRFAVQRFPFSALNFHPKTGEWSSDGWLPEVLERIDPGGEIRRACEEEVGDVEVGAVAARSSAQGTRPGRGVVGARSRVALDAFLADVESKVLLDRIRLAALKEPGLLAPKAGPVAEMRSTQVDADRDRWTKGAPAQDPGQPIWSRLVWLAEDRTLYIIWAGNYAERHLIPDTLVRAGVEVDGKLHELDAEFPTDALGINFTQVRIAIPPELLAAVQASQLELRIAPDAETGKGRLVVLFR